MFIWRFPGMNNIFFKIFKAIRICEMNSISKISNGFSEPNDSPHLSNGRKLIGLSPQI